MNLEERIKHITRYEYMDIMNYPNVVGVGCGYKQVNNIVTNQLSIVVYVEKKYPRGYNNLDSVPKYYDKIPTDVIESGKFYAEGFSEKIRPVKMGYNITSMFGRDNIEGTSGCIVNRISQAGEIEFYILSNNHIMANLNKFPKGTPIIQSSEGNFILKDKIANLSDFIPIKLITPNLKPENYVDAAIAKITNIELTLPQIAFMTIPKGVNYKIAIGSMVKKSGATTGYTTGLVRTVSSTIQMEYSAKEVAYFVDQIMTTKMTEPGDSGSVFMDKNNEVVGMSIGSSGVFSVVNKIEHIEKLLKVNVYIQR